MSSRRSRTRALTAASPRMASRLRSQTAVCCLNRTARPNGLDGPGDALTPAREVAWHKCACGFASIAHCHPARCWHQLAAGAETWFRPTRMRTAVKHPGEVYFRSSCPFSWTRGHAKTERRDAAVRAVPSVFVKCGTQPCNSASLGLGALDVPFLLHCSNLRGLLVERDLLRLQTAQVSTSGTSLQHVRLAAHQLKRR